MTLAITQSHWRWIFTQPLISYKQVEQAIMQGANVNWNTNNEDATALHRLSYFGDSSESRCSPQYATDVRITQLLLQNKADPWLHDLLHDTPLDLCQGAIELRQMLEEAMRERDPRAWTQRLLQS